MNQITKCLEDTKWIELKKLEVPWIKHTFNENYYIARKCSTRASSVCYEEHLIQTKGNRVKHYKKSLRLNHQVTRYSDDADRSFQTQKIRNEMRGKGTKVWVRKGLQWDWQGKQSLEHHANKYSLPEGYGEPLKNVKQEWEWTQSRFWF